MISCLYALHRDNTKERAHHLMIHILYNPLAGSGRSEEKAREAASLLAPRETEILDISHAGYGRLYEKLPLGDEVVLSGGDGTINYFINALAGSRLARACCIIPQARVTILCTTYRPRATAPWCRSIGILPICPR